MNSFRQKLKEDLGARKILFANWTSFGHPQITEIMVRSGVDFLGIDLEHSTISLEQSQRIIAACHAQGVACLPRVASFNPESIKRLLDSGADGLIVPNVESEQQVKDLIKWIKYPPLGERGFGVSRAQGYGHDFENYSNEWNQTSSLIIQVESITGVENIDCLLQYDEVDGVMVGPYDLSGSLGIPGEIYHEKVVLAMEKVFRACKKFGKACGSHEVDPTVDSVKESLRLGSTFVVLSSDLFILWKWGERMQRLIEKF